TGCVQRGLVGEHHAERAAQHRQQLVRRGLHSPVRGGVGQQPTHQVGVGGRAGQPLVGLGAGRGGVLAQLGHVDQVAVVPECQAAAGGGGVEAGLCVLPDVGAAGGVAAVADGDVALQRGQYLFVEDLADQPEVLVDDHLPAVGGRDSRCLLATVLQCVETVVGEFGDFLA